MDNDTSVQCELSSSKKEQLAYKTAACVVEAAADAVAAVP